jgi:hypothetical protein
LMRWIELSPTVVTYNWPRAPVWSLAWAGALKPVSGFAVLAPDLSGRNRAADPMKSASGSGRASPMDPAPTASVVPPERGKPADGRAGGLSVWVASRLPGARGQASAKWLASPAGAGWAACPSWPGVFRLPVLDGDHRRGIGDGRGKPRPQTAEQAAQQFARSQAALEGLDLKPGPENPPSGSSVPGTSPRADQEGRDQHGCLSSKEPISRKRT